MSLSLLSTLVLAFVVSATTVGEASRQSAYVYENPPHPKTPFNKENHRPGMEIAQTLPRINRHHQKSTHNKFTIKNVFRRPRLMATGSQELHFDEEFMPRPHQDNPILRNHQIQAGPYQSFRQQTKPKKKSQKSQKLETGRKISAQIQTEIEKVVTAILQSGDGLYGALKSNPPLPLAQRRDYPKISPGEIRNSYNEMEYGLEKHIDPSEKQDYDRISSGNVNLESLNAALGNMEVLDREILRILQRDDRKEELPVEGHGWADCSLNQARIQSDYEL